MKNYIFTLFALLMCVFVNAIAMNADNMSDTILVEARGYIDDALAKKIDATKKKSDLIPAFLNLSSQAGATLKEGYAVGRTLKVGMILGQDLTCNTARTCSPTGNQPISTVVAVTPFTATARFSLSRSQGAVNDIGTMRQLARSLYDAERSIYFAATNSLDAKLAAALSTHVSSVNAGDGYDGSLVGSVMEIAHEKKIGLYELISSHMGLNNIDGPFSVFSNTHWKATRAFANKFITATNGIDQAEDYGFQQYYSNSLTPPAGYDSKHYVVQDGAMGMITVIDPIVSGFDPNSKLNYRRLVVPSMLFPGIDLNVKEYFACSDTSSNGGQVDDDTVNYEIALIAAIWHVPSTLKRCYNYNTIPSGII